MAACSVSNKGQIYLIPNNFRGRVIIYYNQKNGTPISIENKFQVFKINNNGTLFTQAKANYGAVPIKNLKFYYLDSSNNRTPIKLSINNKKDSDNSQYPEIFGLKDGEFNLNKATKIIFTSFVIEKYDNIKKDSSEFNYFDFYLKHVNKK